MVSSSPSRTGWADCSPAMATQREVVGFRRSGRSRRLPRRSATGCQVEGYPSRARWVPRMAEARVGATLGAGRVSGPTVHEREAMNSITIRGAAVAIASAAVFGSVFTVPAQARIIDRGVDSIDFTYEADCGDGYAVSGHVVGTETFVDKLRGGDVDNFEFLDPWLTFNVINNTTTVTNTDTGIFFTAVQKNESSRDQQLLSVQGTEQTYRRFGTSHFTVYRPDGQIYYRSNGKFQYDYVYDTKGTPDPEDDTDAYVEGSFRFNGRDPGVGLLRRRRRVDDVLTDAECGRTSFWGSDRSLRVTRTARSPLPGLGGSRPGRRAPRGFGTCWRCSPRPSSR